MAKSRSNTTGKSKLRYFKPLLPLLPPKKKNPHQISSKGQHLVWLPKMHSEQKIELQKSINHSHV